MEDGVSSLWQRAFASSREGVEIGVDKANEGLQVGAQKAKEGVQAGVDKARAALK